MDSAIGLANDPIWCLLLKSNEQIKYLSRVGDDVQKLRRLLGRRNGIIHGLQTPKRNAREVARAWMDEEANIGETVALLNNDYDRHKRCLFGWCPDFWFLFRLGRDSQQCIAGVQDVFDRGMFEFLGGQFGEVSPPPATELVPVVELLGRIPPMARAQIEKWFAELLGRSRRIAPAQIQKWVGDDKARTIGVYGMGGVGKIFFVKNVGLSPNLK